ncbi:hypothetical protein Tco_0856608 [Tanacetum coccineum]|uniref:Uncharacterized protein n=1 Tax=Tanacetum coccineum TaxID=301880 RepID=A0ABQ5B4L1_9ASTR
MLLPTSLRTLIAYAITNIAPFDDLSPLRAFTFTNTTLSVVLSSVDSNFQLKLQSLQFEIKEVKEAHESDVRHLEGLVDEVLKLWSELYKLG